MKPRLVDFYCGEGGATRGYQLAGFHVTGVDVEPKPRYCGDEFIKKDALELLADPDFLDRFDVVAGSPPCKSETDLRHRTGGDYFDFLTPTLALLRGREQPWVIENVESTDKLPGELVLCGTEFGLQAAGRVLRRHRRFASNRLLMGAGGCHCSGHPVGGVYGTGGAGQMTRGYKFRPAEAQAAMGIDWMSRAGLSQAIPPAFTRFVGEQLLTHLGAAACPRGCGRVLRSLLDECATPACMAADLTAEATYDRAMESAE